MGGALKEMGSDLWGSTAIRAKIVTRATNNNFIRFKGTAETQTELLQIQPPGPRKRFLRVLNRWGPIIKNPVGIGVHFVNSDCDGRGMKVGDDRTEVAEWDMAMSFDKGDDNSAARLWLKDALSDLVDERKHGRDG